MHFLLLNFHFQIFTSFFEFLLLNFTPYSHTAMHYDFLIVGQGISGTWLSYYLQKAGYSFLVIDEYNSNSPSRVAAGIINPVTGRRIVKTWMIDELLPFVKSAYEEMGKELNTSLINTTRIIDFFPTAQMKLAFENRYASDTQYLHKPANEYEWAGYFNYSFGFGEITPCYYIDLPQLLDGWRKKLLKQELLLEEKFEMEKLAVTEKEIVYKDYHAHKIIFCDGNAAAQSTWFKNLPFAPNKGEALWIEADGLPSSAIFKQGINFVPLSNNLFWVGSSYEWDFQSDQPTELFREKITGQLKYWLKVPFKIIDHRAAVRPATLERRPFVGFHPQLPSIGILNGMGTKGCSLAPFFAKAITEHLALQKPIHAEADIHRFSRLLSRA